MQWSEWPGRDRRSSDGYVYVVEFSNGVVKVGHTTDPARRVHALRVDAARYGLHISGAWLSARHSNFVAAKRLLIEAGRRLGRQLATEHFACEYREMVQIADGLPLEIGAPPASPSALERRIAKRRTAARKMRDNGASMREIARALKVSIGTVHADCRP